MAGTGLGLFLPSETAYKDPGRFRDILEAEGNKEAKYLASMDQFYAQLEEMKREFDVTTEQKERFFEEEMAFQTDKLEWQSEENSLDRALQRWSVGEQTSIQRQSMQNTADYQEGMLDINRQKLEYDREESQANLGFAKDKLRLEQEESYFLRDLYSGNERRTQETHDTAKDLVLSSSGSNDYGGSFDDLYFNAETNTYSNAPAGGDEDDWYSY